MILQVRPKHLLPIDGQRYTPSTKTWQFGTLKKYGTSRVGKKIVVAYVTLGEKITWKIFSSVAQNFWVESHASIDPSEKNTTNSWKNSLKKKNIPPRILRESSP